MDAPASPSASSLGAPRLLDPTARYFKWRVALIATWVVAAAASVAIAFSGGEDNDLGAYVRVVKTGIGTAVNVENRSDRIWKNVQVRLEPGGWLYRQSTLRPSDRMVVQVEDFEAAGAQGANHPDPEFQPAVVEVRAGEDSYRTSLGAKPRR